MWDNEIVASAAILVASAAATVVGAATIIGSTLSEQSATTVELIWLISTSLVITASIGVLLFEKLTGEKLSDNLYDWFLAIFTVYEILIMFMVGPIYLSHLGLSAPWMILASVIMGPIVALELSDRFGL